MRSQPSWLLRRRGGDRRGLTINTDRQFRVWVRPYSVLKPRAETVLDILVQEVEYFYFDTASNRVCTPGLHTLCEGRKTVRTAHNGTSLIRDRT